MSVGPLGGIIGSAAGAPAQQAHGSEAARARLETSVQQRHVESADRAETSAGIGRPDGEDHEAEDRDGDGRRPWEFNIPTEPAAADVSAADANADASPHQSKDLSGQAGNQLDLTG